MLAGKNYFSFMDGFSGYNQIRISPEDQENTTFTCPWGTFAYQVLPFGLCNSPATFQRVVLSIFVDLVHDTMEVFMDDFTSHGEKYAEALNNLDKVLTRCKEVNLCLNSEKCRMMVTQGVVLGHLISLNGIKVDPTNIQVILNLQVPCTQK